MKKRPFGFWLCLIAGIATLCLSALYAVLDYGDKTFSAVALIFLMTGGAIEVSCAFVPFQFLPLLPPLLLGAGTALHLYTAFPSISDLINKIVFIGGNSRLALNLTFCFAAAGLLTIIASFFCSKTDSQT